MDYKVIFKLASIFLSLAHDDIDQDDIDEEEYEEYPGANEERRARNVRNMFPTEHAKFIRDLRESHPDAIAERRREQQARRDNDDFERARRERARQESSPNKTYDLLRDTGIIVTRNDLRDAVKAGDHVRAAALKAKLDRLLDKSLSSYEATRTPEQLKPKFPSDDGWDL